MNYRKGSMRKSKFGTEILLVLFNVLLSFSPFTQSETIRMLPIGTTTCVQSGSQLLQDVRIAYGSEARKQDVDSGTAEPWCLSSDVLEKLKNSGSPLSNHLEIALENIRSSSVFVAQDLSLNKLVSEWEDNSESSTCRDRCSGGSIHEIDKGIDHDHKSVVDPAPQVVVFFDGTSNEDIEEQIVEKERPSSRTKTTTSMLIRLIPVKLLVFLSLMCLALGIRQMLISVDHSTYSESSLCCCFCKLTNAIFGSRVYASYEGIDPSDVSDHQKSVEFELLQLAASSEVDNDEDVEIC